MSFYTIMDATGPVTLCEVCALAATNDALTGLGQPAAETMAEAAVVVATLAAVASLDATPTFSYSSFGTCDNEEEHA